MTRNGLLSLLCVLSWGASAFGQCAGGSCAMRGGYPRFSSVVISNPSVSVFAQPNYRAQPPVVARQRTQPYGYGLSYGRPVEYRTPEQWQRWNEYVRPYKPAIPPWRVADPMAAAPKKVSVPVRRDTEGEFVVLKVRGEVVRFDRRVSQAVATARNATHSCPCGPTCTCNPCVCNVQIDPIPVPVSSLPEFTIPLGNTFSIVGGCANGQCGF